MGARWIPPSSSVVARLTINLIDRSFGSLQRTGACLRSMSFLQFRYSSMARYSFPRFSCTWHAKKNGAKRCLSFHLVDNDIPFISLNRIALTTAWWNNTGNRRSTDRNYEDKPPNKWPTYRPFRQAIRFQTNWQYAITIGLQKSRLTVINQVASTKRLKYIFDTFCFY